MEHVPLITVIIVAHKRKMFILEAIRSVLHQTLDKKYYETIVIKNFADELVDSFLSSHNIKNIISKEETLFGKILEGASIATGYFISILEDDDIFKTHKLYEIKNAYEYNPNIVYIHNNYEIINENHIKYNKNKKFDTKYIKTLDIMESKKQKINFCLNFGYHNNSCITIKTAILLNNYEFLLTLKSNSWVDLSLLFLSLSYIQENRENYCLLVTNKILSEYRIHQSLSSFIPKDSKHFVHQGVQISDDEMTLIKGLSNYAGNPLKHYIFSFLNIENLLFSIIDPVYHGLSKAESIKLIVKIIFNKYKVMSKRGVRIIILSILSLVIGVKIIRTMLLKVLKNGKYI